MEVDEKKNVVYSRDTIELVTVAAEFCAYLEQSEGRKRKDFIDSTSACESTGSAAARASTNPSPRRIRPRLEIIIASSQMYCPSSSLSSADMVPMYVV